jgi:hypothetical protein
MASTAETIPHRDRGVLIAQVLVTWGLCQHLGIGLVLLIHFGAFSGSYGLAWNLLVAMSLIIGLLPALALGGWKAILVATGRSAIRTRLDIAWLSLFGVYTIGAFVWWLTSVPDIVHYW